MGFLDRLFGRDDSSQQYGRPAPHGYQVPYGQEPPYARTGAGHQQARSEDEIALERYRYLLRTAPPETIEEVHAEAFAKLTPEQRRMVYEELKAGPEQPTGEDARSLARSATRSEMRQPGFLEQRLSGNGAPGRGGFGGGGFGGGGFGSMLGASLLGTVAGYVVGSALVSAFMPPMDFGGADAAGAADGGDAGASDGGDAGSESGGGDAGGDGGGDYGGGDGWGTGDGGFFGGGDFAGGGDFGGGDFGGGDFGGF